VTVTEVEHAEERREAFANAKAAAAAEKARAKALRPWYRKKRFILPLGLGVVVVIAAATGSKGSSTSGSASTTSAASGDSAPSSSAASSSAASGVVSHSTNEAHPPAADVSVAGCSLDSATNILTVRGSITNHSSKTSNYLLSFGYVNPGGVRAGEANDVENDIAPGQTANFEAVGTASGAARGGTCTSTSVERLAA